MSDISTQYAGLDYMLRQPGVRSRVGDFYITQDDQLRDLIEVDGVPVQAFTWEALEALSNEIEDDACLVPYIFDLPDKLWVAIPPQKTPDTTWLYLHSDNSRVVVHTFFFGDDGWTMYPAVGDFPLVAAAEDGSYGTRWDRCFDTRAQEKTINDWCNALTDYFGMILGVVGYFQTRPKKVRHLLPQGNMQQAANAKRAKLNTPLLPDIEIVHLTAVQSVSMPRAKNPMSMGGGWTQPLHTRSGHIRRYKSGHTVQVKPYVAGRGAPKKIKLVVP